MTTSCTKGRNLTSVIAMEVGAEQASALGKLPCAQAWTQRLSACKSTALEEGMLQRLQYAMCDAARHGYAVVFSHLLDQGLVINSDVIRSTQQGQSKDVF